jgi:hypothetical protein
VADVINFGPDRQRRSPPRWLVEVGLVALLGAVVAVPVLGDRRPPDRSMSTLARPAEPPATASGPSCVTVGWAQSPPVAEPAGALRIDRPAAGPGSSLDRCDRTAADGPWTVVVRRPDGSLGRHGAVVTFPVGPPAAGRGVGVGGVPGTAAAGMVTWPLAGAYARVRGDIGEAGLIEVAAGTTVVGGRPTVRPPAGYTVVTSGPYRPPTVHELRYGSAAVGEEATLGNGLTYTGVISGGGFEDQLYVVHTDDGGSVDGRPAVVSSLFGGNATLAWEPTPGVVGFVGYSGAQLDGAAVAALQRLAAQTRALTNDQWRATHPQVVDQVNEPG